MNNNNIQMGYLVQQPQGFKAFIPNKFPPQEEIQVSKEIVYKHMEAVHLLGKLDGITQLLPDRDCFLRMFVLKDASGSSQIEGTNATMSDAIEAGNIDRKPVAASDVDDILHYVGALNYAMERLKTFPFTLRFIKEIHEKLLIGARTTQNPMPGEFRNSQNWIGGTRPDNAVFVPPPVEDMKNALADFENFIHAQDGYLPLIKAALLHGQFEAIHPFLDGNGRTGRMLITIFLWHKKLLEMPILYLSSYFRKHQDIYYLRLNSYHEGQVMQWIDFFLDGIVDIAVSSINTCRKIVFLRDRDMKKVHLLNQASSQSTMKVLLELYAMPIVGVADIIKQTGFSQGGAYKLIERMEKMGILYPTKRGEGVYGQKWRYRDYLDVFGDGGVY